MEREKNVNRSLEEITMDIQWNLRKLSAALDRYYGHEPQREIGGYTEPASKANFDPNQPRDPRGRWTRMNIDDAVNHLNENALPKPRPRGEKGECAKFVRLAIEAGGVKLEKAPIPAYLYDPYLDNYFEKLTPTPPPMYKPQKGDIAVFQPPQNGKHPDGHIQMYNGEQWVSDFKQPRRTDGLWPGPDYRAFKPPYAIYRP
ncbi:MAG: hypothetical protein HZA02_07065 [Nitrospinae bacterium]|nr:hypothetical protein [Nitrospinota bacterium]